MTKDQLLSEALSLDPRERDELAEALWHSLTPNELTPDQQAELHRRIHALDTGAAIPVPADHVLRELRQRFGN